MRLTPIAGSRWKALTQSKVKKVILAPPKPVTPGDQMIALQKHCHVHFVLILCGLREEIDAAGALFADLLGLEQSVTKRDKYDKL